MAHDVFISYSSKDKDAANTVCAMLEKDGIHCWIAPRDITPGQNFAEAIIDGIKSSKFFVLVYSSHSNQSPQVIKEVDRAIHHGLSVITLRLEDVPLSKNLEYYISDVHWLDAMMPPLEQHITQLSRVVKMLLAEDEVKDNELQKAIRGGTIGQKELFRISRPGHKPKNRFILVSGIMLAVLAAIVSLVVFNIGNIRKQGAASIESVVVLPFSNYTGADELETLVSGMHACLISDLGRLSGLRVINATTSNVYKNATRSVQEIANELNVDAAIEVSVFGVIDSIIIHVTLISAFPEEETIWNADYKEGKSQLLNLYNRITEQIAGEVKVKLTSDEQRFLAESRTVDPEAMFAYMKGQFYWERLSKEGYDSALFYFQLAIEEDPDWADPYAGMAQTWDCLGGFGHAPYDESIEKAYDYLDKALELDPNSANSHYVKALMLVWPDGDWENGEKEFLIALELQPNHALCRIYYAHLLMILKRFDEAVYQANLALQLDPMQPLVLGLYAIVMGNTGNHQAALVQAQKAVSIDPDNNFAFRTLAWSYFAAGDTLKWYELIKRDWYFTDEEYITSLDTLFQKGVYQAVKKEEIRILEEAYNQGNPISLNGLAECYLDIGNYEKAMDYFEKAYEEESGTLSYLSLAIMHYPELNNNTRYVALLKKMNLPLE